MGIIAVARCTLGGTLVPYSDSTVRLLCGRGPCKLNQTESHRRPTTRIPDRVPENAGKTLKKLMSGSGAAEEDGYERPGHSAPSSSNPGLVHRQGRDGLVPIARTYAPAEGAVRHVPSVIMEDAEELPSTNSPPADPNALRMDASDPASSNPRRF